MLKLAWVTHSFRRAVAATALVAAGSSTALGQAPAAPAPTPTPPVASTTADEDDAPNDGHEPRGTTFRRVSLFDHRLKKDVKPSVAVEPWLSRIEMSCVGCRGSETGVRPEVGNGNAPWALRGTWRRQTALGAFSTGVLGVRNYALPLSTVIPLGGDLDPTALGAAGTGSFLPGSRWSLTAGVEKTLVKRASGASVGVAADVLVPVKNDVVGSDDPRTRNRGNPTVRLGLVFRW